MEKLDIQEEDHEWARRYQAGDPEAQREIFDLCIKQQTEAAREGKKDAIRWLDKRFPNWRERTPEWPSTR